MGLLMAARATNRMGARQQYRTMARMHRRRSYFAGATGGRNDFESGNSSNQQTAPESDYTYELEKLASLKHQGLISENEYETKKKQILGI